MVGFAARFIPERAFEEMREVRRRNVDEMVHWKLLIRSCRSLFKKGMIFLLACEHFARYAFLLKNDIKSLSKGGEMIEKFTA